MNIVFDGNDNILELNGMTDIVLDTFINNAAVTVTVKTLAGDSVAGQSWPLTMDFVPSSNGVYRATLAAALVIEPGKQYIAEIDADGGPGLKAFFETVLNVQTRRNE